MNYKIRVTPQESETIQRICFAMGIFWVSGADEVMFTSHPYLYVTYTLDCSFNENFFDEKESRFWGFDGDISKRHILLCLSKKQLKVK